MAEKAGGAWLGANCAQSRMERKETQAWTGLCPFLAMSHEPLSINDMFLSQGPPLDPTI